MIPLVILGAVIALIVLLTVRHHVKAHGAGPVAWRFLSGHPIDGKHRTDRGWFTPATKVLHPTGRASRLHRGPRATHATVRTGSVLAALGAAYGLVMARQDTLAAMALAVALVLAWGGRKTHRAIRDRDTNRNIITPMAPALAPILDMPAPAVRNLITLKPNYRSAKDGEIGQIGPLPSAFRASPEQRRAVEHLVSSRIPVDADFDWKTRQFPQTVMLLAAPQCPPMVLFTDMVDEMAKCKPGEIVFGADRRENTFIGSFLIDDPHWGFSVGSGRGKSTKLQNAAAQILHQDPGATVTGIDPKMASLTPLIGIPGVVIANDPRNMGEWDREAQRCNGGMWGVIDDFRDEMMDRLDRLAADPTLKFPIKLFILDECNMFGAMTAAKWRVLRDAKAGDPPTPPPWSSLAAIHWMGRQVACHCITVGQRLDDKATGGIGLRSAMGLVGIAGYRQKEWDLLIGTRPMPKSQKPKGRWLYDNGSDQTWVQNICAAKDPAEAGLIIRNYAAAGRLEGVPVGVPGPGSPRQTAGSGTGTDAVWVVGMEAGAAVLGIETETFRKRRYRAGGKLPGEVRQGNQPAWTEADLTAWAGQDAVAAHGHA